MVSFPQVSAPKPCKHLSCLSQYLTNLMHKICFTISFISCRYMFRTHVLFISLWYHHTYRFDDTRRCVIQFLPPGDEHMCSKHVENEIKLNVKQKFCASGWFNTEINCLSCYIFPKFLIVTVFAVVKVQNNISHEVQNSTFLSFMDLLLVVTKLHIQPPHLR